MAEPKFTMQIDIERQLLRITCNGFWAVADVHDYVARQHDALREMVAKGCQSHEIVLLIDTRQQGPQAPDVIIELESALSSGKIEARKVAVLVSSALLARQSRRSGPEHRVFYEDSEAMTWLLSS